MDSDPDDEGEVRIRDLNVTGIEVFVRLRREWAVIKRQLAHRIGSLAPAVVRQLGRLNERQWARLAKALLDFHRADDLQKWLIAATDPR